MNYLDATTSNSNVPLYQRENPPIVPQESSAKSPQELLKQNRELQGGEEYWQPTQEKVNVLTDLLWTTSNFRKDSRIPRVELVEYRQNMSASLMNYIYKLKGTSQDFKKTMEFAKEFSKTANKLNADEKNPDSLTQATNLYQGLSQANATRKVVGDCYSGLYQAELTGNEYVLPFINTSYCQGVSNNWEKAGSKGGSIGEKIQNMLKETSDALNFLELNTQSEEVMEYRSGNRDSFEIQFYLINSFSPEYISKHLEFIYRFKYQNLHLRKTVNTLMPPCIYSVSIPGIKNSPVAVVESFNVETEGICRLMEVPNVFGNTVTAVVPDVYKIKIKIKDLFFNSQNIFSSVMNSEQSKVQVLPATSSAK